MTIKYLANRVQGTRAERFPSLKSTGISLTGCKAYYPFNNGAVNSAITTDGFADGLGSAANGTQVVHATTGTLRSIDGVSGNGGYHFYNAVFDLGDDIINGTGDFSVSLWVNPDGNLSAYRSIVSNYNTDGSNTTGFEFYFNNSDNSLKYYRAGETSVSGDISCTTGAWSHLALTRTSGTVAIYVNGVLDESGSSSSTIVGSNMRVGGQAPANEQYIGGVSEVSIWTRALTAAEILSLSSLGSATVFDETDTNRSYVKTSATEWTEIT